ncbi:hypothetical protein [Paenibacillus dendritiformis]|uniref:hypothetical protein n=1 Tax=Paenibacillus dendritiformis TaxID=130049 RepID=UPI00387E171A
MYKGLIVTSIFIKGIPSLTLSTNEPNKQQIMKLIREAVRIRSIKGDLGYKGYKPLNNGDKIYQFAIGEEDIVVAVERLPIISFEKNSDEYKFSSIEVQGGK